MARTIWPPKHFIVDSAVGAWFIEGGILPQGSKLRLRQIKHLLSALPRCCPHKKNRRGLHRTVLGNRHKGAVSGLPNTRFNV
ncbi:hypothetical protein FHW67_003922 [Herbaspirillum sp. Sphag1AN]|nr:hypothetical protein [Herbaspirillum sp. Sphag1AN]MBB3247747.1 hypothetical protein [Herbaspirillum sp. Sphag64]